MNTMNDEERRLIEELLPWYAAGTLDARDVRRVEDAIAKDPELARQCELILEELSDTVHLNETLGAPSPRAMDKLFAQIDAEPKRARIRAAGIWEQLSGYLESLSPRTLVWAASAAAVVIVLQAGVIGGVFFNQPGGPTTIAQGPGGTVAPGAFALIRFAPDASAADIARLLEANKVLIADGPIAGGLYRLRAATTGLSKDDLAKLIDQLKADKSISFIAPTE